MLLYRGVQWRDARSLLAAHGWGGSWVNGVFDFHHFHSTSHEVLAVISGQRDARARRSAGQRLRGRGRRRHRAARGYGHRRARADGDFRVVGAYPAGQENYDLLREADDAARERIAALGPPPEDPVGGEGVASWR